MTAQRPLAIQTLFLIGFVIAQSLPIHALAADPEVIQLIDQLLNVGSEGIGFHPTAWAGGFMAIDEEPQFRGGIIGSRKPIVLPAMRALVKKGPAALPDLIAHLTDRRDTKVFSGKGVWKDSRSIEVESVATSGGIVLFRNDRNDFLQVGHFVASWLFAFVGGIAASRLFRRSAEARSSGKPRPPLRADTFLSFPLRVVRSTNVRFLRATRRFSNV
jgi:hypothetical protein